jgi:hypothetical protein
LSGTFGQRFAVLFFVVMKIKGLTAPFERAAQLAAVKVSFFPH